MATQWTFQVYTGNVGSAGTDANVFLKLKGTEGWTDEIPLRAQACQLETGSVDEFQHEVTRDVGTLEELKVWHDNSGSGPGWFLDKIVVINKYKHLYYTFPCGKWLAVDCDDHQIERTLYPE